MMSNIAIELTYKCDKKIKIKHILMCSLVLLITSTYTYIFDPPTRSGLTSWSYQVSVAQFFVSVSVPKYVKRLLYGNLQTDYQGLVW